MIDEELKLRIGYVKSVAGRLGIDINQAQKVLDLADTLSPLVVKPEMYRPMLRFQNPLDYDTAAQNVALRELKSRKQFSILKINIR